jgi:hypothetical protein
MFKLAPEERYRRTVIGQAMAVMVAIQVSVQSLPMVEAVVAG